MANVVFVIDFIAAYNIISLMIIFSNSNMTNSRQKLFGTKIFLTPSTPRKIVIENGGILSCRLYEKAIN